MFTCMWPEQKITIIIFNYYFLLFEGPQHKKSSEDLWLLFARQLMMHSTTSQLFVPSVF